MAPPAVIPFQIPPMPARSLTVELGERSYTICIGRGLLGDPQALAPHLGRGAVGVVTDATVAPLYLDRLRGAVGERLAFVEVLPVGEEHKNLATLARLYDVLIDARLERSGTLLALGGGVVGDITGFAAATWQRGVRFIQLPTTLLAQVDSSVGGKTAVNHPRGKNMIGAFHQPAFVLADIDTLRTLPAREYAAGLAEVLKYGLIGDREFHDWLQRHAAGLGAREPELLEEAVYRSCANKARVVAADEREGEGGVRALLNLGHTFGHALETATGYRHFLHGEAVAVGMALAAELSQRLGWIDAAEVAELRGLLGRLGLPTEVPASLDSATLIELMRGDKKSAGGRIRLVLLRRIGEACLTSDFTPAQLQAVLDDSRARAGGARA